MNYQQPRPPRSWRLEADLADLGRQLEAADDAGAPAPVRCPNPECKGQQMGRTIARSYSCPSCTPRPSHEQVARTVDRINLLLSRIR